MLLRYTEQKLVWRNVLYRHARVFSSNLPSGSDSNRGGTENQVECHVGYLLRFATAGKPRRLPAEFSEASLDRRDDAGKSAEPSGQEL